MKRMKKLVATCTTLSTRTRRSGTFRIRDTPECNSFSSFGYSVDATDPKIERLGRLINHSKKDANIVTKLVEVDDHPYLCLMAARDIKEGEELQYDYGERSKAAIDSHPWLNN